MGIAPGLISGIGGIVNAGQAISSGIKGGQASRAAEQAMGQADQTYSQLIDMGMGQMGTLQDAYGQFSNPALQDQILGMAQGAAGNLASNNMAGADALGNRDLQGQAAGMFNGLQGFNFDPAKQTTQQAMQGALDFGTRARNTALEQAAIGMQQTDAGLGAALAGRGLSQNSGVGAAALGQAAAQQGQAMAGLNRDIANQQQATGLQASQFDAQNALQMAGLGSQFQLGMNQSRIGAGQGLAGLQGMQDQATIAQTQLKNAAATDPLSVMQGVYQQNYLAPGMNVLGQMTGMAGQAMGGGLAGMNANLGYRMKGVETAGSGMGSAIGSALGNFGDLGKFLQDKQATTPPTGTMGSPGFGVSYTPNLG